MFDNHRHNLSSSHLNTMNNNLSLTWSQESDLVLMRGFRFLLPGKYIARIRSNDWKFLTDLQKNSTQRMKIIITTSEITTYENVLEVVTRPENCAEAVGTILVDLYGPETHDHQKKLSLVFLIPSSEVGLLIGSDGRKIKQLKNQIGGCIRICSSNASTSLERPVVLTGNLSQIKRYISRIHDFLYLRPCPIGHLLYYPLNNKIGTNYGSDTFNRDGLKLRDFKLKDEHGEIKLVPCALK